MDLDRQLKALSDETRIRIVKLLANDLCVSALAQRIGISDAAASQHLKVLREAGLVKGEKRGYWTHYFVLEEELESLANEIRSLAKGAEDEAFRCRREGSNCPQNCADRSP